jgi:hypothetical protein
MTTLKDILAVLAILAGYGIAGRLDYEDAVLHEAVMRNGRFEQGVCAPDRSPVRADARLASDDLVQANSDRGCDTADPQEASMHMQAQPPTPSVSLMRVLGLAEIEFLVKESEVLTGQSGRIFVIGGADRLVYRVHWHPSIVVVERLGADDAVLDTRHLPPHDFAAHPVVEALAAGQLYTAPVRSTR